MTPPAPETILTGRLEDILRSMATELIANLDADMQSLVLESADLVDLVREAETAQHRRARYSIRDRSIYRLGAAFEPCDGLGLDDLSLTGLDRLGCHGLALLIDVAMNNPEAKSLSQLLARLFASSHGPLIRQWGAYARWHWMQELYVAETVRFLASSAGKDPRASWRRGSATTRQTYLIDEIARALGIVAPSQLLRGEAFDWIQRHGGNPRWCTSPPAPALPSLHALSRGV